MNATLPTPGPRRQHFAHTHLSRNTTFFSLLLAALLTFTTNTKAIDSVELLDGETHQGQLNGMIAGYVLLSQTSGQGSIERRFSPDKIKHLHFSDTSIISEAFQLLSNEQFDAATSLYEGLVWKRLPYLGILEPNDEQFIADLIHCYLMTGRSTEASERIRLWTPRINDPNIIADLEESAMLAAWNSKNVTTAILLAQKWIDNHKPATETALAWRIIAHDHWKNGHAEETNWISLQPITFCGFNTPRHLNYCYALAILSSLQLGNTQHAATLRTEMAERSLPWPIELPSSLDSDPLSEKRQTPVTPTKQPSSIDQLTKLLGHP